MGGAGPATRGPAGVCKDGWGGRPVVASPGGAAAGAAGFRRFHSCT